MMSTPESQWTWAGRAAALTLALAGLVAGPALGGSAGPGTTAVAAPSPDIVDRASAAGINVPSTPSWDLALADYDNDGDTDFAMSLHMKNAGELRRNDGGTFSRVAYSASLSATIMPRPSPQGGLVDRHACTWADFDGNGLQDLYCAAGRYRSNRYKTEAINNELFLQGPVERFVDVATSAGVGEPCTRGRHPAALDVNGDGWQDLFIGAQAERNDPADTCNRLPDAPYNEQSKVYLNRGLDPQGAWLGFRAAPEWNVSQPNAGVRLALPWDYNRDGRPDLLAAAFAGKAPFLYRNTGTGFVEVARSGQVRLPTFNGATLTDLNGDGISDLVFADNTGFSYRVGTSTGVSSTSVRIGTLPSNADGWSVAVGDINGDGRLDVYGLASSATGSGNPEDVVYVRTATGGWQAHGVPAADGDASDVAAVTVGSRAQFVVLNGGNDEEEAPGPVQLIAWAGN